MKQQNLHSRSASDGIHGLRQHLFALYRHLRVAIVVLCVAISQTVRPEPETCQAARARCESHLGCGMALHNYMQNCGSLIYAETAVCSSQCRRALTALLGTTYGKTFADCDCERNEYCIKQRTRVSVCSESVKIVMNAANDYTTDINCSLAELICVADTTCQTALDYFRYNCDALLRGERCTSSCNESLLMLYQEARALKLRSCYGDGTENYNWGAIRNNADTLCDGMWSMKNSASQMKALTAKFGISLYILTMLFIVHITCL